MFDVRSLFAAFRPRPQPSTPFEHGLAALDAGRHEEALRHFAAADPDCAVENKRGVAFVALGRRNDALAAFCDALSRDGRYAPALVNLGNLLLEDGALDDAIDYYRAAIAADESYPLAYRNLGLALKQAGRRGQGVRALRSAVRLEARRGRRRA